MTDPPDAPPSRVRHSKAKRHHYVPETILRRFAGPDLHLWSFDKRHPDYGIERKPIARLFREWDLYTAVDAAGARDRSAEAYLSALESRVSPILERLVSAARLSRLVPASEADRELILTFLVAQFRRSPDYFEPLAADYDVENRIGEMISKWEAAGKPITESERAEIASGRLASRMRRNLLAHSIVDPLPRIINVMMKREIIIWRIGLLNRSFLLGSALFVAGRGALSGRNGMADPTASAWLPIARDVALCSYGNRSKMCVANISETDLRTINGAISQQSTVIASASRKLVASYARRFGRKPTAEG